MKSSKKMTNPITKLVIGAKLVVNRDDKDVIKSSHYVKTEFLCIIIFNDNIIKSWNMKNKKNQYSKYSILWILKSTFRRIN